MESDNKFIKSVIVLILPHFSSKIESKNSKYKFLNLNEIINQDPLFEKNEFARDKKDDFSSLFNSIKNYDFSQSLSLVIKRILEEEKKQIILVNYPSNVSQFQSLSKNLEDNMIRISKVILSNFETFETFEKFNSKFFVCPVCFSSFEKSSFSLDNKNLICPVDKNKFSLSSFEKFNKSFSEYYLKSSLDLAQVLYHTDKKEFLDIVPLIIPEIDEIENFVMKKIENLS